MKIPRLLGVLLVVALALAGLTTQLNGQPFPQIQYLEHNGLLYIAYIPDDLQQGQVYPLVLYMHGSCGECVTHSRITNEGGFQMWHNYGSNTQDEPTFMIAPAGGTGGWTSTDRSNTVLQILDMFIDSYPVDTQRILVMGFSRGGAGTWNMIKLRPDFFAAGNPQGYQPETSVDPDIIRDTPMWVTAGELEDRNWLKNISAAVGSVRASIGDNRGPLTWVTGVNPRFTIFPNTAHGPVQGATQSMPGFKAWMYAQRRDGNITPNIWFTSPQRFEIFYTSPGTVPFQLQMVDSNNDPLTVEIRVNNILQPEAMNGPNTGWVNITTAGNYTLTATATDPGGKAATATLEIVVQNGVSLPSVALTGTSSQLSEGGIDTVTLTVTRTGLVPNLNGELRVNVGFTGDAIEEEDFEVVASASYEGGQIIIPEGQINASIELVAKDDSIYEGTESFNFVLLPGSGYTLDTPIDGSVQVLDNDPRPSPFGSFNRIQEVRDGRTANLGWIWDDLWPFVYMWKFAEASGGSGWLYVEPFSATSAGFYSWSYGYNEWLWSAFQLNGHFYRFNLREWDQLP